MFSTNRYSELSYHSTFTVLCYPSTFTLLPRIIFGQNTAGAHKEVNKKYKSNLEEQATSNAELNTNITRV